MLCVRSRKVWRQAHVDCETVWHQLGNQPHGMDAKKLSGPAQGM